MEDNQISNIEVKIENCKKKYKYIETMINYFESRKRAFSGFDKKNFEDLSKTWREQESYLKEFFPYISDEDYRTKILMCDNVCTNAFCTDDKCIFCKKLRNKRNILLDQINIIVSLEKQRDEMVKYSQDCMDIVYVKENTRRKKKKYRRGKYQSISF